MPHKSKHRSVDIGQIIGAVIFIALLAGLIYLGINSETPEHFNGSFFDDVGKVMQEKE